MLWARTIRAFNTRQSVCCTDALFEPLLGDLVLIPGEPVRSCSRCVDILKKGKRPIYALRFPAPDIRFTGMSSLEFRLCRPIVPVISIYQLPGAVGQYASCGGTVSFVNDVLGIARRLPRPLSENGGAWIRNSKTTNSQLTSEVYCKA